MKLDKTKLRLVRQGMAVGKDHDKGLTMYHPYRQLVVGQRQADKADINGFVNESFDLAARPLVHQIERNAGKLASECHNDTRDNLQGGRRDEPDPQSTHLATRRILHPLDRLPGARQGRSRFGEKHHPHTREFHGTPIPNEQLNA
jgi:hypothetical protein